MNQRRRLSNGNVDPLGNYGTGPSEDRSRLTTEQLRAQAARFIEDRRARGVPSGADRVDLEELKAGRPGLKEWQGRGAATRERR